MFAKSSRGSFHRVGSGPHLLRETKLQYHPLSFIAFCVWTLYTIFLVLLLEYAVKHHDLAFSRWSKIWSQGPGLLITLFAQGHVAVTAWFLGRLGISALQDPRFAPRTWLEMFWISSNQWQSPLGWMTTIASARKRRVRLSVTFAAFMLSVLSALPAPLLLKRAYPFLPIDLEDAHAVHNTTVSSLAHDTSNMIDPYSQLNIGQNAWANGLDIRETYSNRVYRSPNSSMFAQNTANDVLISADVHLGADASLPGIRAQGGCQVQNSSKMNRIVSMDDYIPEAFWHLCARRNLSLTWRVADGEEGMRMSWSMGICHSLRTKSRDIIDQGYTYWDSSKGIPPNETALIWLNMTDFTGDTTAGLVHCAMNLTTGMVNISANVHGDRVFSGFRIPAKRLFAANTSKAAVPYWPPLLTALNALSLPSDVADSSNPSIDDIAQTEPQISKAKMFGYQLSDKWDPIYNIEWYSRPLLRNATTQLWSGALHMAAAVHVGASEMRKESLSYHYSVPWWTRDSTFLFWTLGVLGVWLAIIAILAAFLYRPAFASGMDSYTIARLCAKRPDLLEDDHEGSLRHNAKMLERFRPFDIAPVSHTNDDKGHVVQGSIGIKETMGGFGESVDPDR